MSPLPPDLGYAEWLEIKAALERRARLWRFASGVFLAALLAATFGGSLFLLVTAP